MEKNQLSVLKETLSDTVYHLTYLSSAYNILKSNQLELTAQLGTDADSRFHQKLYYFSFASTKFAGYGNKFTGENVVNLVFDGRKLSQRYKAMPVDYWGYGFRKASLSDVHASDRKRFHDYDEQEQRLYADEMIVPNASSYIKEIHLCFSNKELKYIHNNKESEEAFFAELFESKEWNTSIKGIRRFAQMYDIPLFIYGSFSSFKVLDKRYAYTGDFSSEFSFLKSILKLYNFQSLTKKEYDDAKYFIYDIIEPIHRVFTLVPEEIPDFYKTPSKYIWAYKDFVRKFENEIHNLRKDEAGKQLVSSVMQILSKNKKNTLIDLFVIVYKKLESKYLGKFSKALGFND
jgi:hypothetical protein